MKVEIGKAAVTEGTFVNDLMVVKDGPFVESALAEKNQTDVTRGSLQVYNDNKIIANYGFPQFNHMLQRLQHVAKTNFCCSEFTKSWGK